MAHYAIGLDFGTNSVRALVVDVGDGAEVGSAVWDYAHGAEGVVLSDDPNLARQHPADYVRGAEVVLRRALARARRKVRGFRPSDVIGLGVAATGSTPLPVDASGRPLALDERFADEPAAMAWLWKDHTAVAEAEQITELAREHRPHYMAKCGGSYSSEWFFSKVLHCLRSSPRVFAAAHSWVELADWIPAMLTGTEPPGRRTVGVCAAGHKAMYHDAWGGYPDAEFLARLDRRMGRLRGRLNERAATLGRPVGGLTEGWAARTGLVAGTPVAVGAIDAHLGAVGAGIAPGTLVSIIGTSTCHMMVVPRRRELADIPGLCGIVPGSILPDCHGLEAGQPAVGDLFNWFAGVVGPGGRRSALHGVLSEQAARVRPGASGLLALDWNNGNRTVLNDQRLTGLLLGQTLRTTAGEVYRALIEATAFGALTIIQRFEQYGVKVRRVVACGGIAEKNPLLVQIYADVTGRAIGLSRSAQTCALGAAIAGAVAAGRSAGGHDDFPAAQRAMTGLKPQAASVDRKAHATYSRMFELYRLLHDAFGRSDWTGSLHAVMKRLLAIGRQART